MTLIKIGNKKIGKDQEIFVIGEIGINHNGDLDIAKKLIDMASLCGVDMVKFQKRTPEICVPKDKWNVMKETPWGKMEYINYKRKIEFDIYDYIEINSYCKEKEILWTASVWDTPSMEFMGDFQPPCYKIPSAKLTDKELLKYVWESTGTPIILSTGMSSIYQIIKAWKVLRDADLVLLHCDSEYPSKDINVNLKGIGTLKAFFPANICGFSSHFSGTSVPFMAGVLGAKVVEVHITLDRAMWGTDQAASLEYSGLKRLVRDLKKIPTWLGDGKIKVTEQEKILQGKLRNVDTL